MTTDPRKALVAHPHTIFQRQSQRDDLLDPAKTKDVLIALLTEVVAAGNILLFTAVRSDHHDDSALGTYTHAGGYCADVWPLRSTAPTDYVPATGDKRFTSFLRRAATAAHLHQIGLAGTAYTSANVAAAGHTAFRDDGADHVHIGSQ